MTPQEILRTAVSSGYSQDSAGKWSQLACDPNQEWLPLVQLAKASNLGPLLFDAIRKVPGSTVPSELVDELNQLYIESATHNLIINHKLAEILRGFSKIDVPVVVLKGAALSATIYPEPALRPMIDLDLLIHFSSLAAARLLLERIGYKIVKIRPMKDDSGLFYNELGFKSDDPSRCIVDLHWRLIRIPYYANVFSTEDVFANAAPLSIAGEDSLTLSLDDQLLYLCAHYTFHSMGSPPIAQVDIGYLLSTSESLINWQELIKRSVDLNLSFSLKQTLLESCQKWHGNVPEKAQALFKALHPSRMQLFFVFSRKRVITSIFLTLLTLPDMRLRFTYIRGQMFPSRKYLMWRYGLSSSTFMVPVYVYRLISQLKRVGNELRNLFG